MDSERRVRRRIEADDDDEEVLPATSANINAPGIPPTPLGTTDDILESIIPPPSNDEDGENDSNPDNYDDDGQNDEDEGVDGEDLLDTYEADYAPAPELDYYEKEYLADDDEVQESWAEQYENRAAADMEIDKRYEEFGRRQKERKSELVADDGAESETYEDEDEDDDDEQEEQELNLEAFVCSLREWISQDRTRRELLKKISKFLETYYDGIGDKTKPKLSPFYLSKIKAMAAKNRASLEISYDHISRDACSQLAIWLIDVPKEMLQLFDEALKMVVLKRFPHYASNISKDMRIRIIDLPLVEKLRDLRRNNIGTLIRVSGVVTRRTGVFPMMTAIAYDCHACGMLLGPFQTTDGADVRPRSCLRCQSQGPFKQNAHKSEYSNFQKLTLQESPGSVAAGRVPRYKDVNLYGDLIDRVRPGEEIEVTGVYSHSQQGLSRDKSGFPVFGTVIEANSIQSRSANPNAFLTDKERAQMAALSRDPHIGERIIRSIAPSIYGHRHVKTAVALSLFGGCPKQVGSHRVRGDINILLLGDPGTAKSQILKYAQKVAPRSVYTTGKGASAVGLTAGVHRDPLTKEWTLEGGALVLADQGVCLIDEFDKMSEQDRTSIHEAMEQQTISVSKAGIVCSLQARCAVFAAANPIGGRYDPQYTLAENVELTDPILQRFDILCVLQDIIDPVVDQQLATFVMNSHVRSHPDFNNDEEHGQDSSRGDGVLDELGDPQAEDVTAAAAAAATTDGPQPLDQSVLRKYITYARANVTPVLQDIDSEKIAALYADLRTQSMASGGVPIAVRHIESICRMAEASARMHLRQYVREDDVDLSIKVMLESFLGAQKVSVRRGLQHSFRKYITFGEESNQLLMHQLQALFRDAEKYAEIQRRNNKQAKDTPTYVFQQDFENRARIMNIYDLRPFYASPVFRNHGMRLDQSNGLIMLAR